MKDIGNQLIAHFRSTLDVEWQPSSSISTALEDLLSSVSSVYLRSEEHRRTALFALISSKFKLSRRGISAILDYAAPRGLLFNFHEKLRLARFLDTSDIVNYRTWVHGLDRPTSFKGDFLKLKMELLHLFAPVSVDESLQALYAEKSDLTQFAEVLEALFRGYVFESFDTKALHQHVNNDCRTTYYPSFFDHLTHFYPEAIHRDRSLYLITIDSALVETLGSYDALRNQFFALLRDLYDELTNHCYLAVMIRPLQSMDEDLQWRLYSDAVLYAEKHREVELHKGYFRPEKIKQQTAACIQELDIGKAQFHLANEGYFYRDCFVLERNGNASGAYDILLLFQKNERDETVIPCPACRSLVVQGNSYPVLGVRSWECENTFCPDISKYNRGKRYSLLSLIKQQAIEQDENLIPAESLRQWRLDVTKVTDDLEVLDMVLRHFTLHGDTAVLVNCADFGPKRHGRTLEYAHFPSTGSASEASRFFNSALFHRFQLLRSQTTAPLRHDDLSSTPGVEVYCGDAYQVLRSLPSDTVDGAVTSPPYYNARDYAQWQNIYCYLRDMYNIAAEVYRVLKPGGPFFYNIFDYFDNENTIVFSAMGDKRMILGAYIVHLFRSLGFTLAGNVVWNKGEIEGTRNFNQGNFSPYYQTPFNCWEHVLLFYKGPPNRQLHRTSAILRAKPVMKMVRGQNRLGHTAPFPSEIPSLLLELLESGATVLDPFSGSMTTGLAAYLRDMRSINIDYSTDYCALGLRRLREMMLEPRTQLSLL